MQGRYTHSNYGKYTGPTSASSEQVSFHINLGAHLESVSGIDWDLQDTYTNTNTRGYTPPRGYDYADDSQVEISSHFQVPQVEIKVMKS